MFVRGDKQFATTGDDKTVRVWDAATGAAVHTFGPFAKAGGLHRLADGQALAFADSAGAVRVWDLAAGEPRETVVQLKTGGAVLWVSIAAAGNKIACGLGDSVQVWNLAAPGDAPAAVLPDVSGGRVALSADGKTLFLTNNANTAAEVVDLTAPAPARRPVVAGAALNWGFVPAAGGRVIGRRTTPEADAGVWHALAGPAFAAPAPDTRLPRGGPAFVSGDPPALYMAVNGELAQYDLSKPPADPPARRAALPAPMTAVHGSADGSAVAVLTAADDARTVVVFRPDGAGFKEVARVEKLPAVMSQVRLSADGNALYLRDGGPTGALRKWDVAGPAAVEVPLPRDLGAVAEWDTSADGRTLAVMTRQGFAVWDVAGPAPRPLGRVDDMRISSHGLVAVSPDGRRVVVGGHDGTTAARRLYYRLYDVATMTPRREWVFPNNLDQIHFTPDGRHLLTANSNGTGYVLRLQRGPAKP